VTTKERDTFLEHMRAGMRRGAAAEAMGLSRREVLDEIAEDADLERDVLDAEGEATEHVEEAIYQAAVSGSVAAAKLWMDLRRPGPSNLPVPSSGPANGVASLNALMNGEGDTG
jgi:hypothetical protein